MTTNMVSLDWLFAPEKQGIDLIVLNTPNTHRLYEELYPKADKVILADGASNTIREYLDVSPNRYFPSYIAGDMDSITEETRRYFSEAGVEIVVDEDQDHCDIEKAMRLTTNDRVVIIGEPQGRTDHFFSLVGFQVQCFNSNKQSFFLTNETLMFPVKGETEIHLQDRTQWNYYGIIPINGPAVVSSRRFKWNLDNQIMQFGGLVSSSNEALDDVLWIQSDQFLMVTCSK